MLDDFHRNKALRQGYSLRKVKRAMSQEKLLVWFGDCRVFAWRKRDLSLRCQIGYQIANVLKLHFIELSFRHHRFFHRTNLINVFFGESYFFVDPGTTAVACKETGRQFLGFELNKDYVDMARKRLKQVKGGGTNAKECEQQNT